MKLGKTLLCCLLLLLLVAVGSVRAAVLADDAATVGLWHMETADEYASPSRYWQSDDDVANPGRDNDLALFSSAQPESLLVADGYDGQAMEFNGVNEYARTEAAWVASDSIRIEFWFMSYTDLSVTGTTEGVMSIDQATIVTTRLEYDSVDGRHEFSVWFFDNSGGNKKLTLPYIPNEWTHVVMEADGANLVARLTIDSATQGSNTVTVAMNDILKQSVANGRIFVGSDNGTRKLNGKIDELKVSSSLVTSTFATLSDDVKTKALWHMDAIIADGGRNYIADDDSVLVDRDNDLLLGEKTAAGTSEPSLTSGGGLAGEALDFDGVDDIAFIVSGWNGESEVAVDMWIKPADLTRLQTMLWTYSWVLRVENAGGQGQIKAYAYHDGGYISVAVPITTVGDWYHVQFSVDDGTMTLDVNGMTSSQPFPYALRSGSSDLAVGNKPGASRWYEGLIEEVKMTIPADDMFSLDEPYEDDARTIALWHMEETETVGNSLGTLDDDTNHPGRDNDLVLIEGGAAVDPCSSDGPQIVTSFDPAFGNCMLFDPSGGADTTRINEAGWTGFPLDNVQFEAWIQLDATPIGFNATYTICRIGGGDGFGMQLDELDDGQGGRYFRLQWACWTDSGAATVRINYSDLGANDWHHVAGIFDNGAMSLYIDGILKGTATAPATTLKAPDAGDYFYLGSVGSTGSPFDGKMDEVRISRLTVECGDWGYHAGDLNEDCYVNWEDFDLFIQDWLKSTLSGDFGPFSDTQDFNLPQATTVPTIDGVLGLNEWTDAKVVPMIYPDLVTPPNVGAVRDETGEQAEADDISAICYYKWDSTNLYVFVDVTDDAFISPDAPTSTTTDVGVSFGYPDDHLLFSLDPNGINTDWASCLAIEFWRNPGGDVATHLRNDGGGSYSLSGASMASTMQGSNWTIEVALPWSSIAGGAKGLSDQIGLGLFICDNDAADGARDVFLTDIGNNVSTNAITDPTQFHTVTLTDGLACGDNGYLTGDSNDDCQVDLIDFGNVSATWMKCSDPNDAACEMVF